MSAVSLSGSVDAAAVEASFCVDEDALICVDDDAHICVDDVALICVDDEALICVGCAVVPMIEKPRICTKLLQTRLKSVWPYKTFMKFCRSPRSTSGRTTTKLPFSSAFSKEAKSSANMMECAASNPL